MQFLAGVVALLLASGLLPQAPVADAPVELAVAPAADLFDRQRVRVTASGLDPMFGTITADVRGAWLVVCRDVPDPDPDLDCQPGFEQHRDFIELNVVKVDPDGRVDQSVEVPRVFETTTGRVDCRSEPCQLRVRQTPDRTAAVPVTFGAHARPFDSSAEMGSWFSQAFRGRPPTPAEVAAAVDDLDSNRVTPAELADSLRQDPHTADTVGYVASLYLAYLGRHPDPGGFDHWLGRLRTQSATEVDRAFARSKEFASATWLRLADDSFVRSLYLRLLHRSSGDAEENYWVARLRSGWSRADLVGFVARAAEFRRANDGHLGTIETSVAMVGQLPPVASFGTLTPDAAERTAARLLASPDFTP